MSNYVRNFGVKNYSNQITIPQLIANNMNECFFSETWCSNLKKYITRNERDGRPAKYRWRPLFNAAKFG